MASETSASTIDGEPCLTTSASWAVGWPVHVADIAAHGGTSGVGEGNVGGDGVGLSLADGEADGEGEGVGLGWTTTAAVDPQAETTVKQATASNPTLRLTGHSNEEA